MPDEKEKDPRHPEVNFLPPLNMILAFIDKTFRKLSPQKKAAEEEKEMTEKNIEKLIEKLSEEEEK